MGFTKSLLLAATSMTVAGTLLLAQNAPLSPFPADGSAQRIGGEVVSSRGYIINFNNIGIIEYLRFISQISGKNFIFDDGDLNFKVTIVSEEPTSIDNIMAALMQTLRIHGLSLLEQDNNIIIHKTKGVNGLSTVVPSSDQGTSLKPPATEIITQLFHLENVKAETVAPVLKPVMSDQASVSVLPETNHLIVTDITTNVEKIGQLLKDIDSQQAQLEVQSYTPRALDAKALVSISDKVLSPMAKNTTFLLVPHEPSGSIFILSTPTLVQRALKMLETLDTTRAPAVIPGAAPGIPSVPAAPSIPAAQSAPGVPVAPGVPGVPPGVPGAPGVTPGIAGAPGVTPGVPSVTPSMAGAPAAAPGVPGAPGAAPSAPGQLGAPGGVAVAPPAGGIPGQAEEKAPGAGRRRLPGQKGGAPLPGLEIPKGMVIPGMLPEEELTPPVGQQQSFSNSDFGVYKLRNRKGDQIQIALKQLAGTLKGHDTADLEVVRAIESIQWIEASNSLLFSGTPRAVSRVRQIITDLDASSRQVLIEMLILTTSVDNSLTFGVEIGWRTQSPNFSTAGTTMDPILTNTTSPLPPAMNALGVGITPNANSLGNGPGFSAGVIGQVITHNGLGFSSIGALVTAMNTDTKSDVIMTPKIITEDNHPAEIFVGQNTRYQGQAISNDQGSVITTNYEYRDVGALLKVTPHLGNNNIVTLEIEQELSAPQQTNAQGAQTSAAVGPVTLTTRTKTKVHMPSDYFLIISGMIDNEEQNVKQRTPCLGGLPIIGGAFSNNQDNIRKRNLMIFIRPTIIDTADDMEDATKREQDIWRDANRRPDMFQFEAEGAMDFLNLSRTVGP